MIPSQESCQVKLGYLAHTHLLPKEIPTPRAQGKVRTHLVHLEHLLLFPLHPPLALAKCGWSGKIGCYTVHGKSYPPILRQIELGLRGNGRPCATCIPDADQVQIFRAFYLFGPVQT